MTHRSKLFRPHAPLIIDSEERVLLSEIVDPELIWVHSTSDKDVLTRMMMYLQSLAPAAERVVSISPQQQVAVFYPQDKLWYRAEVTHCEGQGVCEVVYVDYGKVDRTQLQYLRQLPPEFEQSPIFAIPCALNDVRSPGGVWSQRDVELLRSILNPYDEVLFRVAAESRGMFIGHFLDPATRRELNRQFQQQMTPVGPPAAGSLLDFDTSSTSRLSPRFPGMKAAPRASSMAAAASVLPGPSMTRIRAHAPVQAIAQQYPDFPHEQFTGSNQVITKKVKMAYVNSPDDFFVLYSDDGNEQKLLEVSQTINNLYSDPNSAKTLPLSSLATGTPCAALFPADSRWYRAIVLPGCLDPMNGVPVQFVDYGNEEKVPFESTRALPENLGRLPPLALRCRLCDVMPPGGTVAWPVLARTQMEQLLDCELTCVFRGVDEVGKYEVELMNMGCSLDTPLMVAAALHKTGVAVPQVVVVPRPPRSLVPPSTIPQLSNSGCAGSSARSEGSFEMAVRPRRPAAAVEYLLAGFPCRELDEGTELRSIACPFSNGPDDFWLQLKEFLSQLNAVISACETLYAKAPPSELPPSFRRPVPRGSSAIAKFHEDQVWYRAEVLEDRGSDGIKVLFVDFGNEALCNGEEVRKVPTTSVLATTPLIGFRCRLPNLEKTAAWDVNVAQEFEEEVLDENCHGRVLSRDVSGIHTVELVLKNGQDVGAFLVSRGWVKRVGAEGGELESETSWVRVGNLEALSIPAEQGDSIEVIVSHIKSWDRIYVQLKNEEERINWICQELSRSELDAQPPPRSALNKGDVCAAKYDVDGCWYRGFIMEVRASRYEVYFLDYGNNGEVLRDDVRPLPKSLSRSAPNAVRCRVRGLDANSRVERLEGILESKTVSIKLEAGNDQEFQVDLKVESGGDWRDLATLIR